MKWRNLVIIPALVLLVSASCDLFATNPTGGIIKTANGGSDWQFSNKLSSGKGSLGSLSVSRIVYDPHKTDHVYAGTYQAGLFLSEDGGNSWRQILSQFGVYDFVVDPNSSDVIYAVGTYAKHGRVLATRDGGKSWVEIFNEATVDNPVRTIAMNPDNNQELVIGLNSGVVVKSQDAGVSWKLLQTYPDRINRVLWPAGNVLYALVRNTGLFKSTDGVSFVNITAPLVPSSNYDYVGQLTFNSTTIAEYNQMAVSSASPDTIYITTTDGLYRTFNGGASWSAVPLPTHTQDLQNLRNQAVVVAPGGNVVYTAVGAVVYKTSDGGNSWQAEDTHAGGLINAIAVNPDLPQQAFAGVYIQ